MPGGMASSLDGWQCFWCLSFLSRSVRINGNINDEGAHKTKKKKCLSYSIITSFFFSPAAVALIVALLLMCNEMIQPISIL